jgi:SAM-dependent methyltransferase
VAISDLFARLRKDDDGDDAGARGADTPVQPTRALGKFLTALIPRPRPIIIDLGPCVGDNLSFFGEELGCKIFFEELSKDIDHHVEQGKLEKLPAFFDKRFPHENESVDGILCWDVFDYLDRPSAESLVRQLKRVLRPEGVLLAFFGTADPRSQPRATYTRHIVVDRANLKCRPYKAARPKQRPLVNRDIQRLFEPLRITENYLLKTNLREVLFRKPASVAAPDEAPAGQ